MKIHVITAAICVFVSAATLQAQTHQPAQPQVQTDKAAATTTTKTKALNNTICPVSDERIAADGGKKVVHNGYEVSLCCGGCVKKFKKNPDAYLGEVLKAKKAKSSTDEALNTKVTPVNNANCPVSGQPVGSMQKGSNVVYKGYQVGLCCDGCIERFNQNADAYLQELLKPKS